MSSPSGVPARKSGPSVVIPQKVRWHGQLLAYTAYLMARYIPATMRWRWNDLSGQFTGKEQGPVIFSLWHNRLAFAYPVYHHYVRKWRPESGIATMISASKDGALLARVFEHCGIQPVRGSSSRRGRQALLELTRWMERGYHIGITPDGPRGPRYSVQDGIVALAQVTGRPIIPVSGFLTPKIALRSWDRFQVPVPFGRCEVTFAPPVWVPRNATEAERQACRDQLLLEMMKYTKD